MIKLFRTDPSWYRKYYYDPSSPRSSDAGRTRGVIRFLDASGVRFDLWWANMIRMQEVLSRIPPEDRACMKGDEVDDARHLLLGRRGARRRYHNEA
jgi:hypothetical protein